MIKHDFLKIWEKNADLGKDTNENFKFQIFDGKRFIVDPLYRGRRPLFSILSGLRHRTDPIYHIWKSPLGDP